MIKAILITLLCFLSTSACTQNLDHLDNRMNTTSNEELRQLNDSFRQFFDIDTTHTYKVDTINIAVYHIKYFKKQSTKENRKTERLLITAVLNGQVVYTRFFKAYKNDGLFELSRKSIDSLYVNVLPILVKSDPNRMVELNYYSFNLYGNGCGFTGNNKIPGRICCAYFILLGELDSLFHWIQTPYGAINAHGLEGLYYLYNYGISYSKLQMAMIQSARHKRKFVYGCGGCIYGVRMNLRHIAKPLKFRKRNLKFNDNYRSWIYSSFSWD